MHTMTTTIKMKLIAALACLIAAANVHAQNTDSLRMVRASGLFAQKQYDAALTIIDSMIADAPTNVDYMRSKAVALKMMNRNAEAAKTIDRFYEPQNDNTATFLLLRARWKKSATLNREALTDYTAALEKQPLTDSLRKIILLEKANLAYNMQDYTPAHDALRQALKIDSANLEALLLMCNLLNQQKNTKDILPYLQRGLKLYPKSALLLGNMAYRYQNMELFAKAIEYSNKALAIDPKNAYLLNTRGYQKYRNKDYEGAIKDMTKAIELEPQYSYAYKNRALALIAQRKKDKACADLQTAIDKGFTQKWGSEALDLQRQNCGN